MAQYTFIIAVEPRPDCVSETVPSFMQTYEGGLGGEPGNEAHGGYTFCGLAALMLVDQAHQLDLPRLIHWAVHMQVSDLPCPCPALSSALATPLRSFGLTMTFC